MKQKVQQKLSRRERRMKKRIDKNNWSGQSPMIDPPSIRYELADRVQAMTPGGLGVIQQMVKQLDLADSINRLCPIFKMRLPYSEADHVLNIAYENLIVAPEGMGGGRAQAVFFAGNGQIEHLCRGVREQAGNHLAGAFFDSNPTQDIAGGPQTVTRLPVLKIAR